MSHGRRSRGPVGRVSGISRAEGADAVLRVRATERVDGAAPVTLRNGAQQRSFAEVMARHAQGLGWSEPLPVPVRSRPLPPPEKGREDETLMKPEPAPDTFVGLLWWKLKGRL